MTPKPTSRQPIAQNHKAYDASWRKWRRCRDACAGSDRIKEAGVEYLPSLSAHRTDDGGRLGSGRDRYEAYLKRALWYNMSRRTKVGLSGVATMRPPKVATSSDKAAELAKVVVHFRYQLLEEQVEVGRGVMLVNQVGSGDPFPSFFWAESVVNWAFEYVGGRYQLKMLVIEDDEEVGTPENPYETKTQLVRHSYVMRDGACHYTRWAKPETSDQWLERAEGDVVVTRFGGEPLDHIPAMTVGATSTNEPDVEDPILLDLVDVNISHYQNSADLEHGRHWTALPTAVASGFPTTDQSGKPVVLNVGGESAWITEQPGASAHYLEFSGSGLGHLSEGMKDKQAMAAVLGARLLEEQRNAVESAETLKTRHAGERSVLSRVVRACSEALTWSLREMLLFAQPGYVVEEGEDTIDLNTDFLDRKITPAELQAYTATLQAGGISYSTYFSLLQGAEIIPEGRTEEEETELIDAGNPGAASADPFAGKGKPEEPDDKDEKPEDGDEPEDDDR